MARNDFATFLMKQMGTKNGVQHYDMGGVTGPSSVGGGYVYNGMGNADPLLNKATSGNQTLNTVVNPANAMTQIQNDPNHLAGFLGVANNYQASNPYGTGYLGSMVGNQGQIYGQQQGLAQALVNQMYGQGPNPAQAQFQDNTQRNIANAQGMIASQRGVNPALAARMGSNAAVNANSQASNQAAMLQAQQQLAAQGQLGALYGQMQTGNLGYQHLYDQAAMGAQGINADVAKQNSQANQAIVGGLMSGLGGMMGQGSSMMSSMMSKGGRVRGYDDGGYVSGDPYTTSSINPPITNSGDSGTQALGKGFSSMGDSGKSGGDGGGGGGMMSMLPMLLALSGGGGVPINFQPGGTVPGKARVPGNSPKNDNVPAVLSPGEIVIPRTMAHDPEKAKEFIDHLLKNEGKKKIGYGDVLKARRKKAE